MIVTKNDLKEYLKADKVALKRNRKYPSFHDLIWKYEIALRKSEYYENTRKNGTLLLKNLCVWGGVLETQKISTWNKMRLFNSQ